MTGSFAPLSCAAGRIVLGQATAISRVTARQLSPGGATDYDYPVALGNALAKMDFTPDRNHILTNFSSSLDLPACQALGGSGWYYGLTGNGPNTQGRANFLNVIMHEIGHGLGVLGNSQLFFGVAPMRPSKSSWDGLAWSNMHSMSYNDFSANGDARLGAALTTSGQTVWSGARVGQSAALLADNRVVLRLSAPVPVSHDFSSASFGGGDLGPFNDNQIVLVNDAVAGVGPVSHMGCDGDSGQPVIANSGELAGKIALIDRGVCEFGRKALNAQNHGAVAVIIANNVDDLLPGVGGGLVGSQIRIPVIGVSRAAGAAMRGDAAVIAAGVVSDPDRFYGLDGGMRMRLYTPSTYEGGSTFSHVDSDMSPNALMEPAETKTLRADVMIDVALDMFEDLGWPTNRNGTAKLAGCDTTVPVYRDTFIPGANLIAHNNMCRSSAAGSRAKHLRCMNDQIASLHRQSLITLAEMMRARQCVAKL
ncbi:Aminopeptidase YwaD precursor [compost metagenome]